MPFCASANYRQTELYLPSTEAQNATNANGLFSNTPIDSNDSPPGNNQQVTTLSPLIKLTPQKKQCQNGLVLLSASIGFPADQLLGELGSDQPTPLGSSARRSATPRAASPPKSLPVAE
jgi:hypothetical protein